MDFIWVARGTTILSEEESKLFTESFLDYVISQFLVGGDYLVLLLPKSSKCIQLSLPTPTRLTRTALSNTILDYMWLLNSLNLANLSGDVLKF